MEKRKYRYSPDPRYDSYLVHSLLNQLMKDGKKAKSIKFVNELFDRLDDHSDQDPLRTLELGIKNVTPLIEVKAHRVGGVTFLIPSDITPTKGRSTALRWIIGAGRNASKKARRNINKNKSKNININKNTPKNQAEIDFMTNLTNEFIAASKQIGAAMKKRAELYKQAESSARLKKKHTRPKKNRT